MFLTTVTCRTSNYYYLRYFRSLLLLTFYEVKNKINKYDKQI
jgi:hypothetical protein